MGEEKKKQSLICRMRIGSVGRRRECTERERERGDGSYKEEGCSKCQFVKEGNPRES